MKKTFLKEVLRDIKNSRGTFIAIISIVALGAGFFGGIKATSIDMKLTADKYYKDYSMMDFRVVSTLGVTDADAEAIRKLDGVEEVMPSYRVDAVLKHADSGNDGFESVARLHSISKDGKINGLKINEGRLPASLGECVVLDDSTHGIGYQIGDIMEIDIENDPEVADMLGKTTFTVVGKVDTPLYMSVEKGTTNKGSGSIGNFAFIMEEAFSLEAYSELYVTLDAPADMLFYSEEYKEKTDNLKEKLENIGDERNEIRLAEVKAEPLAELSDAKAELNDAENEFKTQKADAQKKLADARYEIDENEKSLEKNAAFMPAQMLNGARAELEAAKEELAKKEAEASEEFAKAELEIADAQKKLNDAQKELDDIKLPDWYALGRADSPGHAGFEQDADRVDAIAVVFPVFFFLIAALVCLTTMTRMVEEQRGQVGILTALGYGKFKILSKYLFYAAFTSIVGSIIGLAIGFQVFPKVVYTVYGMMYTTPEILTPWNHGLAILAIVVFLICILGSTLLACAGELICTPADLIRPKPPKNGKRIILENIPFLWKRFSFTQKLTARNILRYKKRFFMTLIGIAGCTALMLTGFGVKDSISGIVPNQFGNIFVYDAQVGFTEKIYPKNQTASQKELFTSIDENEKISEYLLTHQQTVKGSISKNADGQRLDSYLYVPSDATRLDSFISLKNRKTDEKTPIGDEGAVISEKLARELSLKVGDSIAVEDNDLKTYEIKVTGICENYIQNYIFISPIQYEKIYGESCSYQMMLANLTPLGAQNETQLSTELIKNDEISGVFFSSETEKTFSETFDRLDIVVLVLTVSASLLAFVVLYNLTSINVTERTREIATIKVLGFYDKEVDGYIYRENIILTLLGILLGFLLGIGLHTFVMKVAEVNIALFVPIIKPLSYLWSALLTIVFSVAVNLVIHFRLKKIDMVESLKSNE